MTIIKIDPLATGQHPIESQSHQCACWLEGYIEVPQSLEAAVWATYGWCDLAIQDGKLVGVTPTERPAEPEPAPEEQIATLKEQLEATDYQIIKCSEYQLAGLDMPYDLVHLHTERQTIRDKINNLEGVNANS